MLFLVLLLACEPSHRQGAGEGAPALQDGTARQKPTAPVEPIDLTVVALRGGEARLVASADVARLTLTLRSDDDLLYARSYTNLREGDVIRLPALPDVPNGGVYLDLDAAAPSGHSARVFILKPRPPAPAPPPTRDGLGRAITSVPTPEP